MKWLRCHDTLCSTTHMNSTEYARNAYLSHRAGSAVTRESVARAIVQAAYDREVTEQQIIREIKGA